MRGAEAIVLMNMSINTDLSAEAIAVLVMDLAMALVDSLAMVKVVLDVPNPVDPGRKFFLKLSAIIRGLWANASGLNTCDIFTLTLDRVDLRNGPPRFKEGTLTVEVKDLYFPIEKDWPVVSGDTNQTRTPPLPSSSSAWL